MNLGATLGKVTSGSHTTAGFKEDKKNKATPGITTFCTLLFLVYFLLGGGQTLYYGILFYGRKTSANGLFRSLTNQCFRCLVNSSGVFIEKSVKLRESWSFVQGKEWSIGFKTEVQ